ncbi:hypothetical protein OFN55_37495, partial [Escherichia coli]|nr:hypothetical protein [Escherichia coli]
AASQTPTATPLSNTSYQLTTTWPAAGCTPKKDTVLVTVSPKPVVDAGADQSACEGADIRLEARVSPAGASYKYAWSGPQSYSANT